MEQNLLVAAKIEYTEQLQDVLKESIYEELRKLWLSCKEKHKKDLLRNFQISLCEVPKWNQEIINKICENILEKNKMTSDYLDKIIEAIFLSHIKILSVVKLNDKKQTVNVRVPDTKNFIHKCFIESARNFYTDPYLIDDRELGTNTKNEIQRNVKRSHKIIKDSIEKTIRSMIPMEDILTQYLVAHKESDTETESDTQSDTKSDTKSDTHVEAHLNEETNSQLYERNDDTFPRNEDNFSYRNEENIRETTGETTRESQFPRNVETNHGDIHTQHQDDFEKMPEPPKMQEYNPQEPLFEEQKIKIDLKENESHFFSDSD